VGNGENIKFWKVRWLGNTTLKEKILRVFGNAIEKSITVVEAGF